MKKLIFMGFIFLAILFNFTESSAQREILIPAGKVVLGNYPEGYGNYPPCVIFLPDYYIDQYEVTNEEFAKFVDDSIYQKKEYWIIHGIDDSLASWNWKEKNQIQCPKFWDLASKPYWRNDIYSPKPNTPVVGISCYEAYAYAKWAGKRLPSAAEWEKAARGTSERYGKKEEVGVGYKYSWGENFFKGQAPPEYKLCNWRLRYWAYRYPDNNSRSRESGYPENTWKTDGYCEEAAPVKTFSPQGDSPYGVSDMTGNVWEWTSSGYPKYEKFMKIIKGGGWYRSTLNHLKTGYIHGAGPYLRSRILGFRCVSDKQ